MKTFVAGIATGAAIAVWGTLEHALGIYEVPINGVRVASFLVTLPILAVGMFIGLKKRREAELDGTMTRQQAFRGGMTIAAFAGLTVALWTLLHTGLLTGQMPHLVERACFFLSSVGVPVTRIQGQLPAEGGIAFLLIVAVGLPIALVVARVAAKEPKG